MDVLPALSEENQKTLDMLAEFVDYTKNELTKQTIYKHELKPKQLLVITMFAAVNSYTEAIYELCRNSRPDAAIVILRSITEAWINSLYILGSPNNRLLLLFAIEDSYYRKSLVTQIQKLYEDYPHLRTFSFTEDVLNNMVKVPEDELAYYKDKLKLAYKNKKAFDKAWGSLIDRAKKVDQRNKKRLKDKNGGVEHTYILVYKYLSEYTHLSMRGLQHFWKKDPDGESLLLDKNPDNVDLVLATVFTFYLYFANRLKQYKIVDCSFAKYDRFFKTNIAKTKKTPVPKELST